MIVTLIGMSGVGKSYWSSRLEKEAGFKRICCDDLIGEALEKKLVKLGVKPDLNSIAKWRGLPYEEKYQANERLQIMNEQEVMEAVCEEIERMGSEDIVVDTSGSMVYIDPMVITGLKEHSLMVYIVANEEQVTELYNDEVIFRRPLVWGAAYKQNQNENPTEAMRRCFADLIKWRASQYERWSDISIPYNQLRNETLNTEQFLALLSKSKIK